MLVVVGTVVVLVGVAGGFALHHGPFLLLWQPSEYLIIGGACAGAMLIMSPIHTLNELVRSVSRAVKAKNPGKTQTLGMLVTMFGLIKLAAYQGSNALESHVEHPESSDLFSKNQDMLDDHQLLEFICDTIKVIIIGGVPEHQIAELTDLSLEVHEEESYHPPSILSRIADSLPGMGIVAAVLGIIVTMQHIDGDPSVVGASVAAALVGTFLGVLLSYGIVGPLASKLEFQSHEVHYRLSSARACVLAYARGLHPLLCVEFGRRALPSHLRPSFTELETACRDGVAGAA